MFFRPDWDDTKKEWLFVPELRGSDPVYNIHGTIDDLDRLKFAGAMGGRLPDQVPYSIPVQIPEIDPDEHTGLPEFIAHKPLDDDHAMFQMAYATRDGSFMERLVMRRTDGKWAYALYLADIKRAHYVIDCFDKGVGKLSWSVSFHQKACTPGFPTDIQPSRYFH